MARRRVKKTVKQSASSPGSNVNDANVRDVPIGKNEDAFRDNEVEHKSAAIRAIRDVEIENLLTGVRLLRSCFDKEQLQTPVLQFFDENLPALSIVKSGKDGQLEVQWKDKKSGFPMIDVDGSNVHASLLHQLSIAYPECSAAMPSFGAFELSRKSVQTNLLGADDLQIKDFLLEEPSDAHVQGLQDAFQTPGVSSQRFSVGMTPKTLRLPKNGEMLLSVHGSPLGVYKEDNMEGIPESEEDRLDSSH